MCVCMPSAPPLLLLLLLCAPPEEEEEAEEEEEECTGRERGSKRCAVTSTVTLRQKHISGSISNTPETRRYYYY